MRTPSPRDACSFPSAPRICAAFPAAAQATFPDADGVIAFARGGDLWAVRADGSGLRQLADEPGTESSAAWSPDGTALAYVREAGGNTDVWTLRVGDRPLEIEPRRSPRPTPTSSTRPGRPTAAASSARAGSSRPIGRPTAI